MNTVILLGPAKGIFRYLSTLAPANQREANHLLLGGWVCGRQEVDSHGSEGLGEGRGCQDGGRGILGDMRSAESPTSSEMFLEFPQWCNEISNVSAVPGRKFNPRPGTVG